MTENVYITETGERVRERDGLVEVGLSPEAQAAIGTLLHFQSPKVEQLVREGENLYVVKGKLTAAEFYASVSGRVVHFAATDASISDWMVVIKMGTISAGWLQHVISESRPNTMRQGYGAVLPMATHRAPSQNCTTSWLLLYNISPSKP